MESDTFLFVFFLQIWNVIRPYIHFMLYLFVWFYISFFSYKGPKLWIVEINFIFNFEILHLFDSFCIIISFIRVILLR